MEFIDKAAVVAEIERVLNSYTPGEITSGRYALAHMCDFLDSLETKEVDLNEENLNRAAELEANGAMISRQASMDGRVAYDTEEKCFSHSDLMRMFKKGAKWTESQIMKGE